jgi:hypothetical protein
MNDNDLSSAIAYDANFDRRSARDERAEIGDVAQSLKARSTSNRSKDNEPSTFLPTHAVFALGDFLGKGDAFVTIPWETLQLKQPKTRVTLPVYYPASTAGGQHTIDFARVEIRREARNCITVTAFRS